MNSFRKTFCYLKKMYNEWRVYKQLNYWGERIEKSLELLTFINWPSRRACCRNLIDLENGYMMKAIRCRTVPSTPHFELAQLHENERSYICHFAVVWRGQSAESESRQPDGLPIAQESVWSGSKETAKWLFMQVKWEYHRRFGPDTILEIVCEI